MDRIQRLGDKDNFWQMGDTGPCGPCSEIHIDRGPAFGPDGGPLGDPHGDRFMEFWNLVFMQYNQAPDGSRTLLPKPSIDTGLGLERMLCLLQGVDAVWETDLMLPLIEQACSLTGKTYTPGDYDDRDSFAMRVLAEHARSSTMLVSDGVFPSQRGPRLRAAAHHPPRRALRLPARHREAGHAVAGRDCRRRHGQRLSRRVQEPRLHRRCADPRGGALPPDAEDRPVDPRGRAERRPRRACRARTAFLLHDTYGFPLELTEEIAGERDIAVDVAGFDTEMRGAAPAGQSGSQGQRNRRRPARRLPRGRRAVRHHRVPRLHRRHHRVAAAGRCVPNDDGTVELFLDRTPFYAESGGQVGDTGTISPPTAAVAEVLDTTFALAGSAPPHGADRQWRLVSRHPGDGDDRRRPPRRDPPQPHRHPRAALRAAQGARRARQAGRLAGRSRPAALRLQPLRRGHRRRDRRDRTDRQQRDARQRAGACLRDHQGRGDGARRHRVLRRQVRRHRPGARGRQLDRAVRRHARARRRRHRPDQGRQRVARSAPTCAASRPSPARTPCACCSATSSWLPTPPVWSARPPTNCSAACSAGSTRSSRCTTSSRRCGRSSPAAGPPNLAAAAIERCRGHPRRRHQPRRSARSGDRRSPAARRAHRGARRRHRHRWRLAGRPRSRRESGKVAGDLIKDAAKAVGGGGGGKGDIATAGGKNPEGLDEALRIAAEAAGQ